MPFVIIVEKGSWLNVFGRKQEIGETTRHDWGTTEGRSSYCDSSFVVGASHPSCHETSALLCLSNHDRSHVITIHLGDESDADLFGTDGLAFGGVGAGAECFFVHLMNHAPYALASLGMALRQVGEVGDLGCDEQHGRRVLARGHASAAADAFGRVHGGFSVFPGDGERVRVGRATGVYRDEAAGLDDAVVRTPVYHQVFKDGETSSAPGLNENVFAIFERAHESLACRHTAFGAVRNTVDDQRASATDALAAVMIKRDGLFAFGHELFVQNVHNLEKRLVRTDVVHLARDEFARVVWSVLPPDMESEFHL